MNEPDVYVEVPCRFCGTVLVPVSRARCAVDRRHPDRGLCEIRCPSCSCTVFVPVGGNEVAYLIASGASHAEGSVALELLEPRAGPPVSEDEIVRAVVALARAPYPQEELFA